MATAKYVVLIRRGSMFVVLILILATTGACSLARKSLELEVSRLEDRLRALQGVEADLSDPSFPGGERDLEVFLSYDTLNAALAGAKDLSMPLPDDPETVVTIDRLALEPVDGIALLDLQAHAVRGDFRLDVEMRAQGVIDLSAEPPLFRVRVQDLAPEFSWRNFRFGRWRLARRIATAKADQLALNHLAFPLPLEHSIALHAPSVSSTARQDTARGNGSWIEIRVTRPGVEREGLFRIDRSLMLRDGIHMYASFNQEALP